MSLKHRASPVIRAVLWKSINLIGVSDTGLNTDTYFYLFLTRREVHQRRGAFKVLQVKTASLRLETLKRDLSNVDELSMTRKMVMVIPGTCCWLLLPISPPFGCGSCWKLKPRSCISPLFSQSFFRRLLNVPERVSRAAVLVALSEWVSPQALGWTSEAFGGGRVLVLLLFSPPSQDSQARFGSDTSDHCSHVPVAVKPNTGSDHAPFTPPLGASPPEWMSCSLQMCSSDARQPENYVISNFYGFYQIFIFFFYKHTTWQLCSKGLWLHGQW